MSKEIKEVIEVIKDIGARVKEIKYHHNKSILSRHGHKKASPTYQKIVSRRKTLTTCKDIESRINHVLTKLRTEQPPAGEYDKRTINNTYICPCGNIFVEGDDYDSAGSDFESGVCCPDCGNEKFQTVKDRLDTETQRADKAEVLAAFYLEGLEKSAEQIKELETSKADLLTACEAYIRHQELHDSSEHPKANMFCTGCPRYRKQIEAAIAKAKKEG